MAKVVIGGIFLKAKDPAGLYTWNARHPGAERKMLNFREDDLNALLVALTSEEVAADEHRERHDYGRFGRVWDPEGNRVELGEPTGGASGR